MVYNICELIMKKSKKPIWKMVATYDDIANREFDAAEKDISYSHLKQWIKDNVPENSKDEDIKLKINICVQPTYYDDYIIDGKVELWLKEIS
jgi:hypothetical protein